MYNRHFHSNLTVHIAMPWVWQ